MPHPLASRRSSLPRAIALVSLLLLAAAGCNSGTAPAEKTEPAAGSPAPAPTVADAPAEDAASTKADASSATPARESGAPQDAAPPAPPDFPATGTETGAGDAKPVIEPRDATPGADPLVPKGMARDTTEGWWRIVFTVQDQDYSAGFVKIGKAEGGKARVEEVRTNDIVNPAKATAASEATDKSVRIFFEYEDNKFDYVGELAESVIRGNLQFASPRQNRVRLVPVADSAVTDEALERQQLGQTYGVEPVLGALQAEDPVVALREVAKTWKTSPLLFDAYDNLFQQARQRKLDRATLEALAKEFEEIGRVWGERAEQAAKLNTAVDLMFTGYETDLAREKLEQVRKDAPQLAAAWEDLFKVAERVAAVAEASKQVDAGQVEQGLEALRRLRAESPIDPMATYHLAAAERDHGSKEEALKLFARLAALPQSEAELGFVTDEADYVAPRLAAAKLFEEQKGGRDGFEDFLGEVYRNEVTSFLTDQDRNRTATESGRTALVELFTGAMCPPCVAADVATEAVERSFPGSDVVVLRYHIHVPGPDPLANTDTEARSEYYGEAIAGTPTILIDGQVVPYNIGGGYSGSPEIYAQLAQSIAAASSKPQRAAIDLSASVEGETLRIAAKASGVENPTDTLRLRLVVAESHVGFAARNGIREHEMIVREMPGGASGIAPVNGELAFDQEIPLTELRDRLARYLDTFEASASEQSGRRFAFPVRPLDLRKLTVVAFLQDDATKEVLQAAVVPIEQEVELPPLAAKPAEEGKSGADDSADGPALGLQ